jgi:hypothetical protein
MPPAVQTGHHNTPMPHRQPHLAQHVFPVEQRHEPQRLLQLKLAAHLQRAAHVFAHNLLHLLLEPAETSLRKEKKIKKKRKDAAHPKQNFCHPIRLASRPAQK